MTEDPLDVVCVQGDMGKDEDKKMWILGLLTNSNSQLIQRPGNKMLSVVRTSGNPGGTYTR